MNTILRLQLPTDPRWVNLAQISIEDILTDHAYCEQKAASSCISLIQQYPEKTELVEQLAPIVTEEWGHFRMVLSELKKRNLKLGRQRKDEYVNELLKFIRKGVSRDEQLLDKLLMCGLIEARSCERFKLLSKNISDIELQKFYYKLMVAEAAHYTLFLDLSRLYTSKERTKERWLEWLDFEAEVMQNLTLRGDRMH
ncbi:MAG: tRNA-(ms[2]io[6]A)-hydroxylase [Sphingobacteriales bacterium]|nr:MAG: tRNA-(ms[2]io[6]A)-hydroxylase [Sphingobacteriales bacterium]